MVWKTARDGGCHLGAYIAVIHGEGWPDLLSADLVASLTCSSPALQVRRGGLLTPSFLMLIPAEPYSPPAVWKEVEVTSFLSSPHPTHWAPTVTMMAEWSWVLQGDTRLDSQLLYAADWGLPWCTHGCSRTLWWQISLLPIFSLHPPSMDSPIKPCLLHCSCPREERERDTWWVSIVLLVLLTLHLLAFLCNPEGSGIAICL